MQDNIWLLFLDVVQSPFQTKQNIISHENWDTFQNVVPPSTELTFDDWSSEKFSEQPKDTIREALWFVAWKRLC